VVTNSVVETWPARKTWSFAYLRDHVPDTITGVYNNTQAVFGPLWRGNKPLTAVKSLLRRNPHHVGDMNKHAFFDAVEGKEPQDDDGDGRFVYYTGNLNAPGLGKDVQPLKPLITGKVEHVNLWVGQKGVVTHLHQDTYDNLFVQLVGEKHFVICPPSQVEHVHSFPFLHPSHSQSQLPSSLDVGSMEHAFPGAKRLRCLETTVKPGEVLYVPPLHWHQVTTDEASVSLNVWTSSHQQKAFDAAVKASVHGLNHDWADAGKRAAAITLFEYVFARLHLPAVPADKDGETATAETGSESSNVALPSGKGVGQGHKGVVRRVLATRYAPLWKAGELQANSDKNPAECPWTLEQGGLIEEEDALPLHSVGRAVLKNFKDLPLHGRLTWAGNYIESIALWATGSGEGAATFLHNCYWRES
jgi:hypothetical protein